VFISLAKEKKRKRWFQKINCVFRTCFIKAKTYISEKENKKTENAMQFIATSKLKEILEPYVFNTPFRLLDHLWCG
jgi:hypothetical protein